MPMMMITVAVVVAQHPAVIPGTKGVIDESQVVLDDRAARVLPYLFADDSFSESTTHLGRFVYNLAQPPGFLHLRIIAQIGRYTPRLQRGRQDCCPPSTTARSQRRREATRSMYCCMASSAEVPLISVHASNLAARTKSKPPGRSPVASL